MLASSLCQLQRAEHQYIVFLNYVADSCIVRHSKPILPNLAGPEAFYLPYSGVHLVTDSLIVPLPKM